MIDPSAIMQQAALWTIGLGFLSVVGSVAYSLIKSRTNPEQGKQIMNMAIASGGMMLFLVVFGSYLGILPP